MISLRDRRDRPDRNSAGRDKPIETFLRLRFYADRRRFHAERTRKRRLKPAFGGPESRSIGEYHNINMRWPPTGRPHAFECPIQKNQTRDRSERLRRIWKHVADITQRC